MSDLSLLFMAGANTVEEQRARWERKRSRTAKELLETEHKYLEQLDLVVTFFVTILKAKGTLKPAVLETIFGPLESIYSASHVLSLHLERGNLGRGLENFCQNLELYGHYAENLEQANKTLKEQLKKNKSFRRFKKLQETRPQFQGRKLEDLLPLPLQRLHQYKHFLRDLLENTSPDSAEYQKLASMIPPVDAGTWNSVSLLTNNLGILVFCLLPQDEKSSYSLWGSSGLLFPSSILIKMSMRTHWEYTCRVTDWESGLGVRSEKWQLYFFYHEGGETLKQVAQGSCRCPIAGSSGTGWTGL
ncbi:rho guanine nucleotide exchange factor 39 isoform X2 [Mycteria americana]|uniref:rho guanine nucleotide exchange factor 39 isoform X2 n=1 Tax=Mycteria americana TaxID=33587 RepID=UPI003F586736